MIFYQILRWVKSTTQTFAPFDVERPTVKDSKRVKNIRNYVLKYILYLMHVFLDITKVVDFL